MKLTEYLKSNKITSREFAKQIGVHFLSISRYRTGRSVPAIAIMKRIREVTKGQVDINDFV